MATKEARLLRLRVQCLAELGGKILACRGAINQAVKQFPDSKSNGDRCKDLMDKVMDGIHKDKGSKNCWRLMSLLHDELNLIGMYSPSCFDLHLGPMVDQLENYYEPTQQMEAEDV